MVCSLAGNDCSDREITDAAQVRRVEMFGDWHATLVDSDRMEMFSGSICQSALGFTDIELTTLLTCDYIDNISRNTSEVVSDIESPLMARDEQLITIWYKGTGITSRAFT